MADAASVPIFDGDNHMYETREAFVKFLPDRYKSAIQYVDIGRRTKIMVRNTVSDYIPNPTFDVVARPGAEEDFYRNGNPDGKSRREIFGEPIRAIPAFRAPGPRLEAMNEYGVDRTLMFPTLASLLEERMRDDPEMTHTVIHAFNEWMYETWQFNYEDRIFSTPVITLPIVDRAIEELEWAVARGAKAILIRPAPVPGYRGSRSFALPEFDPFWAKVVEHDIFVAMHGSDSGYARFSAEWQGEQSEMQPFQMEALPMLWALRPAADAVAALACHGVLHRFPQLKIAIVELGGRWLEPLLKDLSYVYKKMPQGFAENPVDALRRNLYLCPFWEENYDYLGGLIGKDHVLFGSDWPHPEGLAKPRSYIDDLNALGLPDEEIAGYMGGNLAKLMNIGASIS
ncbi:amidohydrolase family protein [Frankia sp. AgB32]|uniref:amidohydrolase family protein n=1 Tax=Frankia sp. AgB32 TaxID=631119 RepID=UPI002010224A|nr:amidohydrolase family protein [Frankia sp. AgB32]MCK9898251.1 amidohydrolase [Frankia sp. AgB32]